MIRGLGNVGCTVTLLSGVFLLSTSPAHTAPCSALWEVIAQADDGFQDWAPPVSGWPGAAPEACTRSLSQGGFDAMNCRWKFGYRVAAADAAHGALLAAVQQCVPAAQVVLEEAPVNHPDSYLATRFDAGAATVAVTLKDKAGLGASFVFLRVEAQR